MNLRKDHYRLLFSRGGPRKKAKLQLSRRGSPVRRVARNTAASFGFPEARGSPSSPGPLPFAGGLPLRCGGPPGGRALSPSSSGPLPFTGGCPCASVGRPRGPSPLFPPTTIRLSLEPRTQPGELASPPATPPPPTLRSRSACSEGLDGLDVTGGARGRGYGGGPSPVTLGPAPKHSEPQTPQRGCGRLALASRCAPPGTQLSSPLRGEAGGSMTPTPT